MPKPYQVSRWNTPPPMGDACAGNGGPCHAQVDVAVENPATMTISVATAPIAPGDTAARLKTDGPVPARVAEGSSAPHAEEGQQVRQDTADEIDGEDQRVRLDHEVAGERRHRIPSRSAAPEVIPTKTPVPRGSREPCRPGGEDIGIGNRSSVSMTHPSRRAARREVEISRGSRWLHRLRGPIRSMTRP